MYSKNIKMNMQPQFCFVLLFNLLFLFCNELKCFDALSTNVDENKKIINLILTKNSVGI